MSRNSIIICDLDGTLYNSDHRSHLAQAGKWDEFHLASDGDTPNLDVLHFIWAMDQAGHTTIACTGRNERYRNQTLDWLVRHDAPIETLLMRPDNNYESDAIVKIGLVQSWLYSNGLAKENILAALEDRDKMVDAWRGWGIPCWQVRVGSF